MEKIVLPKCENGKFTQYQDDEAIAYFDIRGKILTNIQLLTSDMPKYIVLPPINKTKNYITNLLIDEFALAGLQTPTLVYTGRGNTQISLPVKQDVLTLILPKNKSLYLVKERADTGYEVSDNYYFLISDRNFEGYHDLGKRELSVKKVDKFNIMGRIVQVSPYVYDRKLGAVVASNEQIKD